MNRSITRFLNARFLVATIFLVWPPLGAVAAEPGGIASTIQNIDVVFVLDNSGSMRENDPDFLTRAAVENFASALAADSAIDGRIGVVLFDRQARLVQELTPIQAGETSALLTAALTELDFSGQRTNSPAGIERALYEFRQHGRGDARQAIIVLTDGKIDTGDAAGDLEAARWLRDDLAGESEAAGIRIFGIAFTDAADYQLMQALARRTHASYYRAFEATELSIVVDDVLLKIGEEKDFQVAASDTARPEATLPVDPLTPNVAAAPLPADERSSFGLWSLLPIAILLVAGGLIWQRRSAVTSGPSAAFEAIRNVEAPPAQLLDVAGRLGEVGAQTELAAGRTRIGRDSHNELVIDDDTISSEHAVINIRNGRYWIEDQRSTNGTRLNDERLDPKNAVQLKGGDHIRVADIDLMFVLAGYVPAGKTVYLSSTTGPPADWRESVDSVVPEMPAASDEQQDLDQAATGDHEDALKPDTEPEFQSGDTHAYRPCLDDHLERVSEISPAFASFIAKAFDDEIREALCVSAEEITAVARNSGEIQQKSYTFEGVRFVLCGVPGEMASARALYLDDFGGFTRMLSEELQSDVFKQDRCETLAVLTFGFAVAPWVSLSIVPNEDQEPRIDLLSYEFLTEEERKELDPSEHADVSQSGLG